MPDTILIEKLELWTHIGVTPGERAEPQRVTVSLALELRIAFFKHGDRLEETVDYAQVCAVVKETAASRQCKLVETLAGEIAAKLLHRFPLRAVEIEVRKYVLPETESVGVKIRREA